jgi:hypothetical protein
MLEDIGLHIIASIHMLTAYDEGKQWTCECQGCKSVRERPELAAAFWTEINRKPPNPKAKKAPPVHLVNID